MVLILSFLRSIAICFLRNYCDFLCILCFKTQNMVCRFRKDFNHIVFSSFWLGYEAPHCPSGYVPNLRKEAQRQRMCILASATPFLMRTDSLPLPDPRRCPNQDKCSRPVASEGASYLHDLLFTAKCPLTRHIRSSQSFSSHSECVACRLPCLFFPWILFSPGSHAFRS